MEIERVCKVEATESCMKKIREYDRSGKNKWHNSIEVVKSTKRKKGKSSTVEEKANFLHDTICKRQRNFLQTRAAAIMNKQPTNSQLNKLDDELYLWHSAYTTRSLESDEVQEGIITFSDMLTRINTLIHGEYGTEIHKSYIEEIPYKKHMTNLEALIMEARRIFKCWFYNHTTNDHQFTMSNRHQELASPEQTASCKDFSNLLMADSLPKTNNFGPKLIMVINAPWGCNEALDIPEQKATGKETSNPFMAGSLPKTTRPT
ncbi:hypothetical protein Tco_0693962 [Tanacetum coccineum]